MKRLLFLFLILSSNAFALDSEVSAAKSAIATKNTDEITRSLVALQLAVNDYELNDGSNYYHPSPARQRTRDEIKTALSPIKGNLILLASSTSPAAGPAITILGFTDGGPQVYNTLKGVLSDTKSGDLASKALFSLSKTGLSDDTVRKIAAQRISTWDPQDNTGSSVALGLVHTAAYIPLPEALDSLIKILDTDSRAPAKVVAATAIMAIGPPAASALPDLKRQLSLLQSNNADFRDINTFKRTIRVVDGEIK